MTGLIWDVDKLRIATDAAGIALWSWNVDTDRLELDERGYVLWGVPNTGTITFEILSSRIHPEDLDRVRAAFAATRDMLGAYETRRASSLFDARLCLAEGARRRNRCRHCARRQSPLDIRAGARRRSRHRRPDYVWRVHRCNGKKEGRRSSRNVCWRNEPPSKKYFCGHFCTDNDICSFNDHKGRNGERPPSADISAFKSPRHGSPRF
jgi:hypothetical protein